MLEYILRPTVLELILSVHFRWGLWLVDFLIQLTIKNKYAPEILLPFS